MAQILKKVRKLALFSTVNRRKILPTFKWTAYHARTRTSLPNGKCLLKAQSHHAASLIQKLLLLPLLWYLVPALLTHTTEPARF